MRSLSLKSFYSTGSLLSPLHHHLLRTAGNPLLCGQADIKHVYLQPYLCLNKSSFLSYLSGLGASLHGDMANSGTAGPAYALANRIGRLISISVSTAKGPSYKTFFNSTSRASCPPGQEQDCALVGKREPQRHIWKLERAAPALAWLDSFRVQPCLWLTRGVKERARIELAEASTEPFFIQLIVSAEETSI